MTIETVLLKKNTAILTVDGEEYLFSYETVLKEGLTVGREIPREIFFTLLEQSETILCLSYLTSQISRYRKTEKGYRESLYRKGYHKKAVEFALAKAKGYGYIDDDAFCESFIQSNYKKKGAARLKEELRQKGVAEETVIKHLSALSDQSEFITILAEKYLKNRPRDYDTRQKLFRHLAAKGFSFDDILNVINGYFE